MHEPELLAMWIFTVIIGGLLTMLMPSMVSAPTRRGRIHHDWKEVPRQDVVDEQMSEMVLVKNEGPLYVVSTSWA